MKKWAKRVRAEHKELAIKILALESFTRNDDKMGELDPYHRSLLWHQLDHMTKYAAVLGERLLIVKANKGSEVTAPSA